MQTRMIRKNLSNHHNKRSPGHPGIFFVNIHSEQTNFTLFYFPFIIFLFQKQHPQPDALQ
jgi:hypothetical protein